MKDSEYAFISEVKEKKRTARGAHNRKTHSGKGGRVKFPSDYMSRKELKAMNGEVQAYRLNEPMSYEEFKALPDDIKKIYIAALRNKFGVTDRAMAEMLDISEKLMGYWVTKLDVSKKKMGITRKFDTDGWHKWLNGIKEQNTMPFEDISVEEDKNEPKETVPEISASAKPESGRLKFKCNTKAALETVCNLLPDDGLCIEVFWCKNDGDILMEF